MNLAARAWELVSVNPHYDLARRSIGAITDDYSIKPGFPFSE